MRYVEWENQKDFSVLKGKTITDVRVNETDDEIRFETSDGDVYLMYHDQSCCENVYIESIVGDIKSLIGQEVLLAEEVGSDGFGPINEYEESYTWTFYKIATIKGHIDIRWYGSSNGYYSESVTFGLVENGE
jgi:hypothetical protein